MLADDDITAEIEVLMRLLEGATAAVPSDALAEMPLVAETVADAAPRERYRAIGPAMAKVAAASIATLPAVLAPVPAFAGTPLPPNLMLAMAARPAAPPTHAVPPALAATGPQLFPFTRPMNVVRSQVASTPAVAASAAAAAASDEAAPPKFELNPRLRSIFSEQRMVSITTKRGLASTIYKVKKGDSLYAIAAETLGSGARWREIYEANKDRIGAGYLLMPGQRLAVAGSAKKAPAAPAIAKAPVAPAHVAAALPAATAPATAPAGAKGKPYVVAAGDNLYTIAAKQLGDATRWREIVALNKATLNGRTLIFPNQWLVLPNQQV